MSQSPVPHPQAARLAAMLSTDHLLEAAAAAGRAHGWPPLAGAVARFQADHPGAARRLREPLRHLAFMAAAGERSAAQRALGRPPRRRMGGLTRAV